MVSAGTPSASDIAPRSIASSVISPGTTPTARIEPLSARGFLLRSRIRPRAGASGVTRTVELAVRPVKIRPGCQATFQTPVWSWTRGSVLVSLTSPKSARVRVTRNGTWPDVLAGPVCWTVSFTSPMPSRIFV